MPRLRDAPDFEPTLDAVAERLAISVTAIEKDYWVTQVLRALSLGFMGGFIFKGGTSLSKGYRILQRFSDDIDILILPGDRGKSATDKLMKAMAAAAASATGGQVDRSGGAETGVHRAYRVSYPTSRPATAVLATSVLLEMGVRGGHHPHESIQIGCLLADALEAAGENPEDYEDLEPFEVPVLHPGRTLLEKLCLIHSLAARLRSGSITTGQFRRHGRHFYDIYQLLDDPRVLELLSDNCQMRQIVASIEQVSRAEFETVGELRPEGGFAASPAFNKASPVFQQMREAYETIMPELYFGAEPLPTWQAICERVAAQGANL